MAPMRARSLFQLENSALASSTLLVKCSSTTCKVSVIAFFPDDLSRTSYRCVPTRATRKQRTNKLGRCYQPERPICTLARYSLPIRTAPFTYMCLSTQVKGVGGGGNARARWSLARRTYPYSTASITHTSRYQLLTVFSFNSLLVTPPTRHQRLLNVLW